MSSGNSLDFTKEDLDLFESHGVAVKEMEAAAVAWAAHLHATPMFALKAITDIVDGAPPSAIPCKRRQTESQSVRPCRRSNIAVVLLHLGTLDTSTKEGAGRSPSTLSAVKHQSAHCVGHTLSSSIVIGSPCLV